MIATTGGRAPFDLRDCEESDIGAITALYAHYVLTSLAAFEEIADARDHDAALHGRAPGGTAVPGRPRRRGTLLGFAYAAFYRTRSAYRFTIEDSIYVAPGTHPGMASPARLLLGWS